MCYIETPANPTNALFDLEGLRGEIDAFEARHGYRPLSVCDNTLLGPLYQKPSRQGIDLSVYSLTKYIGGHSDLVAGGVTGARADHEDPLGPQHARLAARPAFVVDDHALDGNARAAHAAGRPQRQRRRPLARRQSASAGARAAPELIDDPAYQAVYQRQCSGPGSTFAFILDGGREQAFRFINHLTLFKSAVSLGGTESLICHPASTTHSGVPAARARRGVGRVDSRVGRPNIRTT